MYTYSSFPKILVDGYQYFNTVRSQDHSEFRDDELNQYAVIIQYMVLELRHRYLSLYRYRPVVRRAVFASRI